MINRRLVGCIKFYTAPSALRAFGRNGALKRLPALALVFACDEVGDRRTGVDVFLAFAVAGVDLASDLEHCQCLHTGNEADTSLVRAHEIAWAHLNAAHLHDAVYLDRLHTELAGDRRESATPHG